MELNACPVTSMNMIFLVEMDLCEHKVPTFASDSLAHTNQELYGNIHTAFVLLRVVPVTSYECDRSVSRLRCLKTYSPRGRTRGMD